MPFLEDYDGAWKETIEVFFWSFLELCFPAVAREIDWGVEPEFLDQELQEIVRDSETGKQRVDKLVKVRRLDGEEECIFLHIEAQEEIGGDLAERMYRYNHRVSDRYQKPVVSLLFLTGARVAGRGRLEYRREWLGCVVHFVYPVCWLDDLGGIEALRLMENPVGVVAAAHLAVRESKKEEGLRYSWKKRLIMGLYEKGYDKKTMMELFRLVDWLLRMSREKEVEFRVELKEYEKAKGEVMPYITSFERLAREEGQAEGWMKGRVEGRVEGRILALQQNVVEVLEARFDCVPEGLKEAVEGIGDEGKLSQLIRAAAKCADIESFAESL